MIRPLLALLGSIAATSALAQSPAPPDECAPITGTYLNAKVDLTGKDPGIEGRTVLSLAAGGTAMMTDSAQGGVAGYQPFGTLLGPWSCTGAADGKLGLRATLVDFSYPTATDPQAKTARIEIDATVTPETGAIEGETVVYLFALLDDPFADAAAKPLVSYTFKGQKVPAP
ncbi:MAG: hypothetical protein AAF503_12615 [Pseudomonadota bacterium]